MRLFLLPTYTSRTAYPSRWSFSLQAAQAVAQAVPVDVAQGFMQQAFVDPSDPTKFYISEPMRR